MRKPSGRLLINRVDVYVATTAQGADGSYQPTYPSTPTYSSVPCTVQSPSININTDEFQRVTETKDYKVMFATDLGLNPRDKIVWIDSSGVSHSLFVDASKDYAGRGAAFGVHASETI